MNTFTEIMGLSPESVKTLIGSFLVLIVVLWTGFVLLGKLDLLKSRKITNQEMVFGAIGVAFVLILILSITMFSAPTTGPS